MNVPTHCPFTQDSATQGEGAPPSGPQSLAFVQVGDPHVAGPPFTIQKQQVFWMQSYSWQLANSAQFALVEQFSVNGGGP